MPKNIVLFLDGTWNTVKTDTNVHTAYQRLLAEKDATGKKQISLYEEGVGTDRFTWITGGAFGRGLSKNVKAGYQFLVDHYEDGDKIFIFGFSRGAYTARSVAGMIVRYGLLRDNSVIKTKRLFNIYAKRWPKPVRTLTQIEHLPMSERDNLSRIEKQIMTHSRRVDIQFLGLWDTVGMLGIPKTYKTRKNPYSFHHRGVSSLFQNVAHALSIDENRKFYKPTLFYTYVPKSFTPAETQAKIDDWSNRVEQRWFAGSHGDVGGSTIDAIGDIPLAWIMERAELAGLALKGTVSLSTEPTPPKLFDSYKKAGMGLYRTGVLGPRFFRPIQNNPAEADDHKLVALNEVIDASVFDRYQKDSNYRPKNLEDWAAKSGIDLKNTSGDQRCG